MSEHVMHYMADNKTIVIEGIEAEIIKLISSKGNDVPWYEIEHEVISLLLKRNESLKGHTKRLIEANRNQAKEIKELRAGSHSTEVDQLKNEISVMSDVIKKLKTDKSNLLKNCTCPIKIVDTFEHKG